MIYQKDSSKAEEFIHHEEILDTLEYAQNNKDNRVLIEQLIEKAALCKGLTHREAAILLECNQPDLIERIFHLAKEIDCTQETDAGGNSQGSDCFAGHGT